MAVGLTAAERGDAAPAGAASLFGNNCQAIWHFFQCH
jgi:hypothetical protein